MHMQTSPPSLNPWDVNLATEGEKSVHQGPGIEFGTEGEAAHDPPGVFDFWQVENSFGDAGCGPLSTGGIEAGEARFELVA
jgi:hypothetical protein